ncbi:MAG: LacI family DNA-binding transcriptional regulator [Candidatus Dormibacteria bacterium]
MNPPSRRLRIDDVAKLAGVSPATVSRVMSGSRRVSDGARERVLAAAHRFDYQPNQLARNLRRGQTTTVGVLVSDIENPHFATMVRSIEAVLYDRGARVLLCNSAEDTAKQSAYLEVMAAERVMGVLISPAADGDAAISRLMDLGIPIVAFDRPVADPRADAVVTDNAAAVARGTQLLVDSGRRKIGFIGGQETVWTASERLAGYAAAIAAAGLSPLAAVGDFTVEGGQRAAEEILEIDQDLDGLVIANNQMTIGALAALRARRIPIPDQVGLVAFDDPPWASLLNPPLTTLAQPLREMCEAAVDRLFMRMADAAMPPQRICFECRLEIRESSQVRQHSVEGG